jgi:hypothetical protein
VRSAKKKAEKVRSGCAEKNISHQRQEYQKEKALSIFRAKKCSNG